MSTEKEVKKLKQEIEKVKNNQSDNGAFWAATELGAVSFVPKVMMF